jgi:hypothetical protein
MELTWKSEGKVASMAANLVSSFSVPAGESWAVEIAWTDASSPVGTFSATNSKRSIGKNPDGRGGTLDIDGESDGKPLRLEYSPISGGEGQLPHAYLRHGKPDDQEQKTFMSRNPRVIAYVEKLKKLEDQK